MGDLILLNKNSISPPDALRRDGNYEKFYQLLYATMAFLTFFNSVICLERLAYLFFYSVISTKPYTNLTLQFASFQKSQFIYTLTCS